MSNEEAIKILKEVREEVLAKETELSKQVFENLGIKAIDLAIKALEQQQEPSEDCISRQVVKEMLTEEWTKYMPMELDINLSFVLEKISELPSVIPIRPHGEWIHFTDDFKDYVACSCCGYGEEGEVLLEDKTPFCPVCGADMREGETDAG